MKTLEKSGKKTRMKIFRQMKVKCIVNKKERKYERITKEKGKKETIKEGRKVEANERKEQTNKTMKKLQKQRKQEERVNKNMKKIFGKGRKREKERKERINR